jgi:hypothetical protein
VSRMSEYHAELSEEEITNDLPAAKKLFATLMENLHAHDSYAYYRELLRARDLLDVAKMKAGVLE